MREKIVLIGAGSRGFTGSLVADMTRMQFDAELVLVDIDPQALDTAERLMRKLITARQSPIHLSATTDRRTALEGATTIITTISVGGRRAWEQDVFIPRKYGIYAPVGDTVGPGGLSRALRMIPPMIAIARDVQDIAPGALFFNYSNPMAAICRALNKETGTEVVGLCHGIKGDGLRYLSQVLGIAREAIQSNAIDFNHLTWFTDLRAEGEDLLPRLREIAPGHIARVLAQQRTPAGVYPHDYVFSWQLFLRFGVFPCVLDRHVTEFFPQFFRGGQYYGKRLGVDAFSFEGTIASGDSEQAAMARYAREDAPLPGEYIDELDADEEEVIDILTSIRGDRSGLFYVNLPNRGQVPNMLPNVIVESRAIADARGLHALVQLPLPAGVVGTLMPHYLAVEAIVEAALEGSRDKFVQALVVDGSVDSMGTAAELADELLHAQAAYLPQFRRSIRTY